jgi:hypothetical protein
MDQRIAVDEFDRATSSQSPLALKAAEAGRLNCQKGAQALAAIERAMAHGSEQTGRTGDFAGLGRIPQQSRQLAPHGRPNGLQPCLKLG